MADNTTSHTISEVIPDSPADMAGIRAGDVLRAAGGQELVDIFDYHYLTDEETVTLSVLRNGEAMDFTIEKEIGEEK